VPLAVVLVLPLIVTGSIVVTLSQTPGRVEAGTWGGNHLRLEVRENGAAIEYDCGHGEITGALTLTKDRRFDVRGTFVREGPGPIRVGRGPASRPARYKGQIKGTTLTLTVTLTDKDPSQEIGTFTLTRGSEGRLWKCR
jgi:hypothetical protein